jgi:class 3 adenylate cyclase
VVIIETAPSAVDFIDPSSLTAILMALAEHDVRGTALQTPVLGVSPDKSQMEIELSDRLDEEFTLLTQNIRNLFQGLLMGSISPDEAEQYVDGLIGLTERGKERLLSVLAQEDNMAEMKRIERAAAVLGAVWEAEDVYFSSGASGLYSRLSLDPDGVFRRIYPRRSDNSEHVVYAMMNRYFGPSDIEPLGDRLLLRFKGEGFSRDIALDSRGAVLTELPRGDEDFKRLTPRDFAEYERVDRELTLFLDTMRERGYFIYLTPEAYPTILYTYSHTLREELLGNAEDNRVEYLKTRWLDTRTEYLRSLENFAAGTSEMNLVMSYEERIAAKDLEPDELRRLVSLRDDLIGAFAEFRKKYDEFLRIRSSLSAALAGSFCILGPGPFPLADSSGAGPGHFLSWVFPPESRGHVPSATEVSALLANAILSGRVIIFPAGRSILHCSLFTVLLILFLIRRMRPILTLAAGLSMTLLAGAMFSGGFILTRYWFDPLIPTGSAAAGVLSSFMYTFSMKRRDRAVILRMYSGAAGPAYLKRLIRAGRPLAGETLRTRAAIVAIRKRKLLSTGTGGNDPQDNAGEIRAFREKAALYIKNAGGVIVGIEGDGVLFAFGSPLERIAQEGVPDQDHHSPEARAIRFIRNLLRKVPEAAAWRFGIDAGDCAFGYSELSGYAAFGLPVVYARILSGLAARYHAHILVTARVTNGLNGLPTRKLDAIANIAGKEKETFYEILITKKS